MPEIKNETTMMPMLALRGLSVFPGMLLTFDVERPASVAALDMAVKADQIIFLAAQKDLTADMPEEKDIYHVGSVCRIRQQLRQASNGVCRVMVEGLYRAEALEMRTEAKGYAALVRPLPDKAERVSSERMEALLRSCLSLFEQYLRLNPDMVTEQILNILAKPEPAYVASYIAQNVRFSVGDRQQILEAVYPSRRLALVVKLLSRELNVLGLEKEINEATQEQMSRIQREYYLREEMKLIQQELGEDGQTDDIDDYRRKVNALPVKQEIKDKLLKELSRLAKQPFGSSEAAVIRNYLDVCLEIPWGKSTQETVDIAKARKLLDEEHFGLEKVKKRILEYLAVRQLSPEIKGGLICLVGPPGTGKTSIAMSIAKAVNRKLVRVSLGGVHDEAEIRGHRKTYIGSMPGRIISGVIQAKSCNPLMVLDEIDKLGSDYRGDPSAALLEALDGEQNESFRDNFLEIPFDLSQVFFITTANTTETIPRPLLDRMEVIELSSYTDEEKLQIAKRHLFPKQLAEHGLKKSAVRMSDDVYRAVIRDYTRESGVRLLERRLAAICRKADMRLLEGTVKRITVTEEELPKFLDCQPYPPDLHTDREEIGVVNGLAWTEAGGEILEVEVNVMDGSGKLELTGNLGDVMKESAQAALSCLRSRAAVLGIPADFYKTKDIHVHFPEGAVPKDGPSAGIAVTTAMLSALTDRKIKAGIAMTGEVTLRGRVLPIGGLKEKTMAALRSGITTVLIPKDNVRDLEEIDQTVRAALRFVPVETVDQVFAAALCPERDPIREEVADHVAAFAPAGRESGRDAAVRQ